MVKGAEEVFLGIAWPAWGRLAPASWLVLACISGVRSGTPGWSLVGQVIPVFVALSAFVVLIAWAGLVLHAAIRVRAGVLYVYPFVLRFLK